MKIRDLILATFLLLIIAGNIHAASFDCSKATSEVEKIICSDNELSRLDESLNKAYLQALKRTDDKEQTIESQRQWLKRKRDACENAECLKNAYETRIWALSPSSHDDYRWTGDLNPAGEWQHIPVDPKICKLYEENLRYFAKRNTPMSCNRPIAPHLEGRIKEVEWEDLDPDQYPDLLRAIAKFDDYLLDRGEDEIQRHLTDVRACIANKVRVFRRAKLSLVGDIHVYTNSDPEPYWIVQYGINDISPNNPVESWRCKPTRGGVRVWRLNLYIVSEAKHELTKQLFTSHNSTEGQHLRIIDNRLFVENINPEGMIELDEVDTAKVWGGRVCIFRFKRSE